jgi:glycosyltransferase 2 family protein
MRSASLSVTDILSIMPLVNTVTALPISFGGVGVRETLFQELLGNLAHVPPAIAAVSASLGFAIQASWGLLGAVVFLAAKKLKSD